MEAEPFLLIADCQASKDSLVTPQGWWVLQYPQLPTLCVSANTFYSLRGQSNYILLAESLHAIKAFRISKWKSIMRSIPSALWTEAKHRKWGKSGHLLQKCITLQTNLIMQTPSWLLPSQPVLVLWHTMLASLWCNTLVLANCL